MKRAPIPRQSLSSTSNYTTLLNQRFSSPASQLAPQTANEGTSTSRLTLPQSEISYLPDTESNIQRNPYFVLEESNEQRSPPYPLQSTLLPRAPSSLAIERALDFCTHIVNNLATHIKQFPTIQPLHYLVSNLPHDLLIQLSMDDCFVHFAQRMLTPHEQEVFFWDKLTLNARNHNAGSDISSSSSSSQEDVQRDPPVAATAEAKPPEPDHQEDDRTDPPFSITFEPTPRKPRPRRGHGCIRFRLQQAKDRQADAKAGYTNSGVFRVVLDVPEEERASL